MEPAIFLCTDKNPRADGSGRYDVVLKQDDGNGGEFIELTGTPGFTDQYEQGRRYSLPPACEVV